MPNARLEQTSRFGVFHAPNESELEQIIDADTFFKSLDTLSYDTARVASINERKVKNQTKVGPLTYGEAPYSSLSKMIQRIQDRIQNDAEPIPINGTFVDLGSGAGRPVFAAAISYPFETCIGIEIMESLHNIGMNTLDEYHTKLNKEPNLMVQSSINCSNNDYNDSDSNSDNDDDGVLITPHRPTSDIQLYCASIYDVDAVPYNWRTNADLILLNSTCFTKDMIHELELLTYSFIKDSTYFITFSECLNSDLFELLTTDRFEMSWGEADVYYHRKRRA